MVRNTCAHYGRLYNKDLTIKFKLDKSDLDRGLKNDTIFTAIYLMGKLTKDEIEWRSFVINLKGLIEKYEKIDISLMGFPDDWEELLEKVEQQGRDG
jgi:abortive infection bacteriophage resistance protein